jgi:hypothetical protein
MNIQIKPIHQLITLLFCCLFLCSCAQQKKIIKQVYAFYNEKVPGIIQTDENGNPLPVKIDTVIVVYIETTSKVIFWDSAWNNTKQFKIISQIIETKSYEAGFKKGTTEKVVIAVDPEHFLYQLYLQPININLRLKPVTAEINELILKGTYKTKTILQKTGKLIELEENPSV